MTKKKEIKEVLEGTIPEEELEVYEFDARDFVPEGATVDNPEVGDVVDESVIPVAPTTHDIEEAIPGTLEEV
jgi:hypothetical protein